jgi:hypothetical protein
MNKKGQIYIIAAILLSVVIFAIATVTNVAKQEKFKGDFEKLSNNYELEGAKLINTIANTQGDVGSKFGKFTYDFTAYSKTQNPQFGVIYVLDYNNTVYVGNYMTGEVYVDSGSPTLTNLQGCFGKVGASVSFGALSATFDTTPFELDKCVKNMSEPPLKKIYMLIGDAWYPFQLVSGKAQLMVVSQMEQAEQRKVFIGGEGFIKETEAYCEMLNDQSYGKSLCMEIESKKGPCYFDQKDVECKVNLESVSALQEELSGTQTLAGLQAQLVLAEQQLQTLKNQPPSGLSPTQLEQQKQQLKSQIDQLKKDINNLK